MTRLRSAVAGLVGVVGLLTAGPATSQPPAQKAKGRPTINEKVLDYAKKSLGERVGNGECWTLAHDALGAAGAKSSPQYRDFPSKDDYVWGDLVLAVTTKGGKQTEEVGPRKLSIAPGDIIQFRGVVFSGPYPGGGNYTLTAPRHTAVVADVGPDGRTLGVLHQNWNGKRVVQELTFVLGDLTDGGVRVYRPLPR
ncbi:MAG TPA: hypothetical protein VH092_12130 [Urbifossiella sp.]|jgi:hypothetical protein|nr:hypothetical protein [Urbifossiella sp.]